MLREVFYAWNVYRLCSRHDAISISSARSTESPWITILFSAIHGVNKPDRLVFLHQRYLTKFAYRHQVPSSSLGREAPGIKIMFVDTNKPVPKNINITS